MFSPRCRVVFAFPHRFFWKAPTCLALFMPRRADPGNSGAPRFAMTENLSSACFQGQSPKVDHGPAGFPPGARPMQYSIPGNSAQKMLEKPNY
jgi:hypothetical protein